jgi:hypothetical protein
VSLVMFMGALSPHVIRHLSGQLPPGLVIWCMRGNGGAWKWAACQLSRLLPSAGSGHHTPSVFYLIHTDGGSDGVQQSRR